MFKHQSPFLLRQTAEPSESSVLAKAPHIIVLCEWFRLILFKFRIYNAWVAGWTMYAWAAGWRPSNYLAQGKRSGALGWGQANVATPSKGKSISLSYTFALTGRAPRSRLNLGRRFACPGLGNCWAFSTRLTRYKSKTCGLWNCWAFSLRLRQCESETWNFTYLTDCFDHHLQRSEGQAWNKHRLHLYPCIKSIRAWIII